MSKPSSWPLGKGSVRFIVPAAMVDRLASHPLSRDLYPTSFGHYEMAAGHFVRREVHDDYLLLYCIEGRASADFGRDGQPVSAGDLLVLPCGVSHAYQADAGNPWTVSWVHFQGSHAPKFLANFSAERGGAVLHLGVKTKLVADFRDLLESRHAPVRFKSLLHAANHLRQLLAYLALVIRDSTEDTAGRLDLDAVHALMERDLAADLGLERMAASVHMSKYHFSRTYRRLTGVSPVAHFIQLKIERACRLLDTTRKSSKEIARSLGYDDSYYFSRLFKRVMGYSPRQYRDLNKG